MPDFVVKTIAGKDHHTIEFFPAPERTPKHEAPYETRRCPISEQTVRTYSMKELTAHYEANKDAGDPFASLPARDNSPTPAERAAHNRAATSEPDKAFVKFHPPIMAMG